MSSRYNGFGSALPSGGDNTAEWIFRSICVVALTTLVMFLAYITRDILSSRSPSIGALTVTVETNSAPGLASYKLEGSLKVDGEDVGFIGTAEPKP